MKLLSIIIPAYNSQAYLHRCLDSLLVEEVMGKVEVIVVNDGSNDRTLTIAKEYENRFPRYFHVFNKKNGNYGSVMNLGLSVAKGKYFKTLDSDDWFNKDAYRAFVDELQDTDADMLISERSIFNEKEKTENILGFDEKIKTGKDLSICKSYWENKSFQAIIHVSSICYKTSLLHASNMQWTENIFYTDTEYDYMPLRYLKTIRFIKQPVYVYLLGRDEQSTDPKILRKNFHSLNIVANTLIDDFLKDPDVHSEIYPLQKKILTEILFLFYLTIIHDGFIHGKEIEVLDRKLRKIEDLDNEILKRNSCYGRSYVKLYRENLVRFYWLRKEYQIRHSQWYQFVRRILGRN